MMLSVSAILCGRLRSGGETGLWPAAVPSSGTAGGGAVLPAFADQSEPNPSPPVSGLRRSQTTAANRPGTAPQRLPRRQVELYYDLHWYQKLELALPKIVESGD